VVFSETREREAPNRRKSIDSSGGDRGMRSSFAYSCAFAFCLRAVSLGREIFLAFVEPFGQPERITLWE